MDCIDGLGEFLWDSVPLGLEGGYENVEIQENLIGWDFPKFNKIDLGNENLTWENCELDLQDVYAISELDDMEDIFMESLDIYSSADFDPASLPYEENFDYNLKLIELCKPDTVIYNFVWLNEDEVHYPILTDTCREGPVRCMGGSKPQVKLLMVSQLVLVRRTGLMRMVISWPICQGPRVLVTVVRPPPEPPPFYK